MGWRVPDDDLLSHGNSVLSSACCRFTVLFGMGRGGSGGLWSSGIEGESRGGLAAAAPGDLPGRGGPSMRVSASAGRQGGVVRCYLG